MTLPMTVEQPGAMLSAAVEASVDLVYQAGKWKAQCRQPPVATVLCDSLEQALVTAAKEIAAEIDAEG
jgi:hypothetical protein